MITAYDLEFRERMLTVNALKRTQSDPRTGERLPETSTELTSTVLKSRTPTQNSKGKIVTMEAKKDQCEKTS